MGLDWVVIAKVKGGKEINPTDILGVKRASRSDSEVMEILRDIHTSREEQTDFDDWLDSLIAQDPPPIIIPFGPESRNAIPGIEAEAQYYGFRGKALEPKFNRLSTFAVSKGRSMEWIWEDQETEKEINASIRRLTSTLEEYSHLHPQPYKIAKQRFESWYSDDTEEVSTIDEKIASDPELQEQVIDIFAYLAAISWLTFWQDKGFVIVADF